MYKLNFNHLLQDSSWKPTINIISDLKFFVILLIKKFKKKQWFIFKNFLVWFHFIYLKKRKNYLQNVFYLLINYWFIIDLLLIQSHGYHKGFMSAKFSILIDFGINSVVIKLLPLSRAAQLCKRLSILSTRLLTVAMRISFCESNDWLFDDDDDDDDWPSSCF
jgi:hypothetical protein